MDIPRMAVVCAARHYIAAHESAKLREIVDFGKVCAGCEFMPECRGNWEKTAAPIFEAAQQYPKVFYDFKPVPSCIEGSPLLSRLWRNIHARWRIRKNIPSA